MDYWDYIAHSRGSERAGHRYYARELVGTKGGKNVYRYFYSAQEYSAYKNSKTPAGRGTYAETGTSRNAIIWPKGTVEARVRAKRANNIAQQKEQMDRERRRKNIAQQKEQMDRERRRKNIAQQKEQMDRERRRKNIKKQKVAMDRARRQKIVADKKHLLDNIRQRPYYQPSFRR